MIKKSKVKRILILIDCGTLWNMELKILQSDFRKFVTLPISIEFAVNCNLYEKNFLDEKISEKLLCISTALKHELEMKRSESSFV